MDFDERFQSHFFFWKIGIETASYVRRSLPPMSESSSVNSEVWDYLEKILVFVECVPKLRARNGDTVFLLVIVSIIRKF